MSRNICWRSSEKHTLVQLANFIAEYSFYINKDDLGLSENGC